MVHNMVYNGKSRAPKTQWLTKPGAIHPSKRPGYKCKLKGKPLSEEHKRKIGNANKGKRKGMKVSVNSVTEDMKRGISPYNYGLLVKRMLCPESKCQYCGKVENIRKLHLPHDDIFNRDSETVDIDTLIVLCQSCHKKADIAIWGKYKEREKVN